MEPSKTSSEKIKKLYDISDLDMIIMKKVSTAARYELVAEEAIELAHATLKIARILRGDNPTPATMLEAKTAAEEELNDLVNAVNVTDLRVDLDSRIEKMKRWIKRLEASNVYDNA